MDNKRWRDAGRDGGSGDEGNRGGEIRPGVGLLPPGGGSLPRGDGVGSGEANESAVATAATNLESEEEDGECDAVSAAVDMGIHGI